LKIWVPMMSLGIRSGVHWMREKEPEMPEASAEAAVVFARPGTDSRSTWPPAASAASRVRRRFSWPTTRDWKTWVMLRTMPPARSMLAGGIAGCAGAKAAPERPGAERPGDS
jgi:hypothetical protein